MTKKLLLPLALLASQAAYAQHGDCTPETNLTSSAGVLYCEPFESADWWVGKGYEKTSNPLVSQSGPMKVGNLGTTSVVSSGCLSGSCLKIHFPKNRNGSINVHWPLRTVGKTPQELYLRYYLKLGADFDPKMCRSNGTAAGSTGGGKFPGLADARVYPLEQCGNGGAGGDGINCWSMRSSYGEIRSGINHGKPNATTQFGSYTYMVGNDPTHFVAGPWHEFISSGGYNRGSCSNTEVWGCGIGSGGILQNEKWQAVEMYVKMNTPGQYNGVIRGWVDGKLSYEKTNTKMRLSGHDNLHVRTVWLNYHVGGEGYGLCTESEILMDQMVVSEQPIGLFPGSGGPTALAAPENLRVD